MAGGAARFLWPWKEAARPSKDQDSCSVACTDGPVPSDGSRRDAGTGKKFTSLSKKQLSSFCNRQFRSTV